LYFAYFDFGVGGQHLICVGLINGVIDNLWAIDVAFDHSANNLYALLFDLLAVPHLKEHLIDRLLYLQFEVGNVQIAALFVVFLGGSEEEIEEIE
jgi:hypothetical protein